MPKRAQLYLFSVIAAGVAVLGGALCTELPRPGIWLALYLSLAVAGATLKVRLPGMTGTYSLGFLFTLFGLTRFSLLETLSALLAGVLVQSYWKALKRPTGLQVLFNLANLTMSTGAAWLILHRTATEPITGLALATAVYFFLNTILVSGILSLLQGQPLAQVAAQWYLWSFPYYLLGAVLVSLLPAPGSSVPAVAWLLLIPVLVLVHFYQGLAHRGGQPSEPGPDPGALPRSAKLYAEAVIIAGGTLLAYALFHSNWAADPLRFTSFFIFALVAAAWKLRLPGLTGTLSMGFVPLLAAALVFPLAQASLLAALVGLVQCLWKTQRRPSLLQALFNSAALVLSTALASGVCVGLALTKETSLLVLPLLLATVLLYGSNTLLVTTVLCLVQRQPLTSVWQRCYFWSFPYYLVGAAGAGLMIVASRGASGAAGLGVLPVLALVFLSYRLQVQQSQTTPQRA